MILTDAIKKKIRDRSHIRLDDIFGQARIRRTMYEYECLRQNKNEKIGYLKWIIDGQGEAITRMIDKINELEQTIDGLEKVIESTIDENIELKNENERLRKKLGEEVG